MVTWRRSSEFEYKIRGVNDDRIDEVEPLFKNFTLKHFKPEAKQKISINGYIQKHHNQMRTQNTQNPQI